MKLGLYNSKADWLPYETERQNFLFLGKPSTGKTETLTRLALDDIYDGESVVFVGSIAPILDRIPLERRKDVIVFNPELASFALNFFNSVSPDYHSLLAGKLYEAVKSIWFGSSVSTANIEQYMRGCIQTLLTVPDATFLHIKILLTNPAYRTRALRTITDPVLKDFWYDFEALAPKDQRLETASTLNKLRTFPMEPLVRNCIGQEKNALVFDDKIVLIELPENRLGSENARLLGTLVLAYLYVCGAQGVKTNLYVDEAERFGATILKDLLNSENISTQLTLQSLTLLRDERHLILGAIDSIVAFRTTVEDAEDIEPEFFLDTQVHLHSTPDHHAFLPLESGSILLKMPPVGYTVKKGAREKILARCAGEYTTRQPEAIEKRIQSIYERATVPEKKRSKRKNRG